MLNFGVFSDELPEKKLQLVGMSILINPIKPWVGMSQPCGTSIQTQTTKFAAEQPGTSRGCGRSTEQKIDEERRTDADPIDSEEAEDGTPRALDHGEQAQLVGTIGSQSETSVPDKQGKYNCH
jgi:hypothetical protein